MDAYEKLHEKLDLFPFGFPEQPETHEMLRLLFSEKEAVLAAELYAPPLMQSARRLARKTGMNKGEAAALLEGMVARGLIMALPVLGEERYMLMAAYPGFIEMQFMDGQELTEDRKKAGELWHKAYSGPMGKSSHGFPTAGMRVVPVKKSVDATQRVFSYEEVEKIVKASGSIAVTKCACRVSAHNCDRPVDVCMMFGAIGSYAVDKGMARKVNVREALVVLDVAEEAGLIHMSSNTKPPVSIICNCCTCCCSTLKGITVVKNPADTMSSNFVSRRVEDAECKKCKKCEKACPMEAISMGEDGAVVDEENCLGCGVCVSKCSNGAITMKRKRDRKPLPSTLHLLAKMYEERGKLPQLLENVQKEIF